MIPFAWNWLRRNPILVLLLAATICLALALGELIRWCDMVFADAGFAVCGGVRLGAR